MTKVILEGVISVKIVEEHGIPVIKVCHTGDFKRGYVETNIYLGVAVDVKIEDERKAK